MRRTDRLPGAAAASRSRAAAAAAAAAARIALGAALVATGWAAAGSAHARTHGPRCRGHVHARRCGHRRPAPHRPPDAVSVHAHEYRLTLSRPAVHGGQVIVEFANEGEDPHNLELAPVTGPGEATAGPQGEFPKLPSGKLGTQRLTLTPGTWRLWCSLPGHAAAGMHATLTVLAR